MTQIETRTIDDNLPLIGRKARVLDNVTELWDLAEHWEGTDDDIECLKIYFEDLSAVLDAPQFWVLSLLSFYQSLNWSPRLAAAYMIFKSDRHRGHWPNLWTRHG